MKFCESHWNTLRKKLDEKGLTPMISTSGREVVERMAQDLGQSATTFDPLMFAHNLILLNVINFLGFGVLMNSGCPLCTIIEEHKKHCTDTENCQANYEDWLDYASDDAEAKAKELFPVQS